MSDYDEFARELASVFHGAGEVLDTCLYRNHIICACEHGIFVRSVVHPDTEAEQVLWSKIELRELNPSAFEGDFQVHRRRV